MDRKIKILTLLRKLKWEGLVLIGIYVTTLPIINPYVRGDGVGYYAYVRSVVIDLDLKFENEFRRGDPLFKQGALDLNTNLNAHLLMPKNYVRNQWAVGPSLLWSPFFLIAHGTVICLNGLGFNISADGYSLPYRVLSAFGTTLYSFIGLFLSFQVAKKFASSSSSIMATIGIWFASPLLVYMYLLPFHVHALAAFSVSTFLWYWIKTRYSRVSEQWGIWGLMGGLMVNVYYINSILLLLAMFDLIKVAKESGTIRNVFVHGAYFCIGGFITLLPHWIIKWIIHGSPFTLGYYDQFFWLEPRLWLLGFGTEHGLFLWTPILLLSVLGIIFLIRREGWIGWSLLVTLIVFYYVIASYQNWHGLSSFGNRFFVSFSLVFVLGLAILIDTIQTSLHYLFKARQSGINAILNRNIEFAVPPVICFMMLTVFICWNIGFVFQWGANLIPSRGAVDFSKVFRNQVSIVPQKIFNYTIRYLISRKQVIREIEAEDILELKKYHWQR